MIIPAKLFPVAVIIPVFPVDPTLDNLKFPATKLLRVIPVSNKTSDSNVDTPTALFSDLTSLKVKSSTFV